MGRRQIRQTDLADLVGKSPMWVHRRLTQGAAISVDDMQLFAAALGCSVSDLMGDGVSVMPGFHTEKITERPGGAGADQSAESPRPTPPPGPAA